MTWADDAKRPVDNGKLQSLGAGLDAFFGSLLTAPYPDPVSDVDHSRSPSAVCKSLKPALADLASALLLRLGG